MSITIIFIWSKWESGGKKRYVSGPRWSEKTPFLLCVMFVVLFLPSFQREEFFQIFVHDVKEDMPLVLTLWQDEPGRALREAVLKQCPSLPSYFILLSRGRKVRSTVIWIRGSWESVSSCLASHSGELKNHDEADDVCWLGRDWNENVSFGGKKET